MNEASKAASLIACESSVDDIRTAISLIARYDMQAAKIDAKTTDAHIRQILPKLFRGINTAQWDKQISYYIDHATEYPLSKLDGVPITVKEMDTIRSIDGARAKCFAFSLLAVAKYDVARYPETNYWVRGDRIGEVVRRANLTLSQKDLGMMVHRMYKDGMVGLADRKDSLSLHVLFADECGTTDMVLTDPDYRDLGYCLRARLGERYTRCEECGRWIKQKSKGIPKRYCDACSADNHRVSAAAHQRRKRA